MQKMFQSKAIAVLTYHSLDESRSVLSIAPQAFADQMQILHERGVRVVPISELGSVLKMGGRSESLVAITFDDGFRSVYQHGFPVLERYGFPATVFLVSDYCGKANSWPGQPMHIERRPLLQWSQIREMSAKGITFGSHTRTHPDLTTVSTRDASEELIASKHAIEDAIGSSIDTFAYPYGAYNNRIKQLAKTHFTLACSATLGFVHSTSDSFALERLDMYYLRRTSFFQRLFSREIDAYIRLRRTARDIRKRTSVG